jgi:hypothetical protein
MRKAAHEEWAKIPPGMFQNSFKCWPARVLAIHRNEGKHAPTHCNKKIALNYAERPLRRKIMILEIRFIEID